MSSPLINLTNPNIPSRRSGPGAIPTTSNICEFTSTGTSDALTLADGVSGQKLDILYVAEGNGADTGILTPTTLAGNNSITFNNLGEGCSLVYSLTIGWVVVGIQGAVLA